MNSLTIPSTVKRFKFPFCLFIFTLIAVIPAMAQEKPPKPITVTVRNKSSLNFGTFCYGDGSGTTVTISAEGAQSITGNIVLISGFFSPAIYDVISIPGTLITVSNGPDIQLTGSNGGKLLLHIGNSFPQSPFITTSEYTEVKIGGTLTIGAVGANPPGSYNGTFQVTFIQQ